MDFLFLFLFFLFNRAGWVLFYFSFCIRPVDPFSAAGFRRVRNAAGFSFDSSLLLLVFFSGWFTQGLRVVSGSLPWLVPGFSGFSWAVPGFTGFLLGGIGFYWVLMGFTGFYWVLSSFTGFSWVSPGFTGFYRVLCSFTGFYWVLPGFTGFNRILLGITDFFLGLTRLFCFKPDISGLYKV